MGDDWTYHVLKQKERDQLLQEINKHKYFISLVVSEGFGMIPLEAMALGTVPVGLDGYGGRDYFDYGQNSFCVCQKKLTELPSIIRNVQTLDLSDVAENAKETADQYSFKKFAYAWDIYFEKKYWSSSS